MKLASVHAPGGIALDQKFVCFAVPTAVLKVPLAGGSFSVLAAGQDMPWGVAVDSSSVYWTNLRDGTVMKVPMAGGSPIRLASGQAIPSAIAVDAGSVYWTNERALGPGGTVMKLTPK